MLYNEAYPAVAPLVGHDHSVVFGFGSLRFLNTCPFVTLCYGTIVVGELHTLLQDRRREMKTDAFKQEMHRRNGIEGTHSELVRGYGLRQARYRGKAKVTLQNYFSGAACNVRRLFRRIEWLAAQARGVDTVATPALAG